MESAQASGSGISHGRTLQQKIRDIIGVPLDEIEKKSKRNKTQNNHNFKTVPQLPRDTLVHEESSMPSSSVLYQCTICGKKLTTRQQVMKHIAAVHEKIKPHACSHCDKRFASKPNMKAHVFNIHEKEKPAMRIIPPSEFLKRLESDIPKVSRKEELNSDEEKEWEGHICKICDSEYVSKSGLAQHISLVHEKGKTKSYKCPICDGIFHQISVFKNHVKTVHEDEGKKPSYECEICDQKCTTKKGLTQHVLAVHEIKKPYACPHCDRKFAAKSTLKGHIYNVHERKITEPKLMSQSDVLKFLEAKPYKKKLKSCESKPQNLANNLLELKTNKKSKCGSKNATEASLIRCQFCDKVFGNQNILKNHIRNIHEEVKNNSSNRSSFCEKDFATQRTLLRHISSVHEKKKPHACPQCKATFAAKNNLKQHIYNVHEKERPEPKLMSQSEVLKYLEAKSSKKSKTHKFQCEICDKVFPLKTTLENHIQKIHEEIDIKEELIESDDE